MRIIPQSLKPFLLLLIAMVFALPYSGKGQSKLPLVIKRLITANVSIPQITANNLMSLEVPEGPFSKNMRFLYKTEKDLYLGLDGSGYVYRLQIQGDSLLFERVDRTLYAGSSFCAAHFSLDEQLFSLGGYGFWKTNGIVRSFNRETMEWDVVPIKEEKPNLFSPGTSGLYWTSIQEAAPLKKNFNTRFAPAFFWVDSFAKQFYSFTQRIIQDGIMEGSRKDTCFSPAVYRLDLKKGNWESMGDLQRYGWNNIVTVPWGLLINETSDKIYLADIIHNKIRFASPALKQKLQKLYAGVHIDLLYSIDSTVYFGNLDANTLDSFSLSSREFQDQSLPLYKKKNELSLQNRNRIPLFIIGSLMLLFFLQSIISRYRKKGRSEFERKEEMARIALIAGSDHFTEVEKSLLQLLVKKATTSEVVSTEEMNKVIGVASKTEAIKRKARSEIIGSINSKWSILNDTGEKLITANRSSQDRRNREYSIRQKFLENANLAEFLQ